MPSAHRALPLSGLVAGLGPALASIAVDADDPVIDDITLAEPGAGLVGVPGDLTLGVGVSTVTDALDLLDLAASRGVRAVMLRRALADEGEVAARAREGGIPIVAVADQASWAHVAWLLRDILDRASHDPGGSGTLGPDELFTLADACAAAVGGSVTIEDTRNRVLAYSEAHDLSDPARVSTIVGRRVPAAIVTHLRGRGVFRRLARSTEPLFLPAAEDGTLGARVIVPVHAGGEWVGSIWATVDRPLAEESLRPLREIAAVVALHLLRLRTESDLGRQLVRERLRAALAGDPVAAGASLPAPPWRVVVLGAADGSDGSDTEQRLAVWESLCRRAAWQRPTLLTVDEDVVAIVTERPDEHGPGTWAWLARLTQQAATSQPWACALSSPPVVSAHDLGPGLGRARELARLHRAGIPGVTLTAEEAWAPMTVGRAIAAVSTASLSSADAATEESPLAHLDDVHRETLRAWLDHPSDLRACAQALHVHPNTVRYRLGRIRTEIGADLHDPTVRLALALLTRAC